jgi:hypothetical protein
MGRHVARDSARAQTGATGAAGTASATNTAQGSAKAQTAANPIAKPAAKPIATKPQAAAKPAAAKPVANDIGAKKPETKPDTKRIEDKRVAKPTGKPEKVNKGDGPSANTLSPKTKRAKGSERKTKTAKKTRDGKSKPKLKSVVHGIGIKPLDDKTVSSASGPAVKTIDSSSTDYNIRGAGSAKPKTKKYQTQITAIIAVAVIICLLLLIWQIIGFARNTAATAITLTAQQTRSAQDKNMPVLTDNITQDFNTLAASLTSDGMSVFTNNRYVTDVPDATATGTEIVAMPVAVSDDFMNGFYEGSYNAFSVDQLEQDFNGAFVVDRADGDKGTLLKVKYANLNATSISDEMQHLESLQGLTNDKVEVVGSGTDSRGNSVDQGTVAIGNTTYFWKVAACPLNQVYTTTSIPDNAVYITCTLATYDFYTGADTLS